MYFYFSDVHKCTKRKYKNLTYRVLNVTFLKIKKAYYFELINKPISKVTYMYRKHVKLNINFFELIEWREFDTFVRHKCCVSTKNQKIFLIYYVYIGIFGLCLKSKQFVVHK